MTALQCGSSELINISVSDIERCVKALDIGMAAVRASQLKYDEPPESWLGFMSEVREWLWEKVPKE